jgi:kynurenine formamidase
MPNLGYTKEAKGGRMCAPNIMKFVNQKLSRRDLFKTALAGSAASALTTLPRVSAQSMASLNLANMADLTHTIGPNTPMFPGFNPPKFTTLVTVKDNGFYGNLWEMWEHTGTHLDAPAHFIEGGLTADKLPLESFIAPIAVIDIEAKTADDDDAVVTVDDITAWESVNGQLPDGVVVMMYSGWEKRLADPATYVNQRDDGTVHFPGFSPEAATFLVNERNITGIGVDTLSQDPGNSTTFDVHVTILGAGKYGIENVANLSTIPASGAYMIMGSLKIENASGGPVRLMAAWA